jgi:Cdc6-like AAA superfamily ATPase
LIGRDESLEQLAAYLHAVVTNPELVKTDKGFDIFSTVGIPGTGKTVSVSV